MSAISDLIDTLIYTGKNLPRDISALLLLHQIKKKLAIIDKTHTSVSDHYSKWLSKQPDKPCIIFNETIWTFRDLENYANKIGNLFKKCGLKKGDVVALLMDNKPEYVGIWYGLSKLGVITACINTNLRSKPLIHSIVVANPKVLVYCSDLAERVDEVSSELPEDLYKICQGSEASKKTDKLEELLKDIPKEFFPDETVTGKDTLMYIYTSGTTGLPKPAIIKHNRYLAGGFSFFDCANLTKNDVFMVTLPIYHSNASCMGIGAALVSGATVVLRKKFSASSFWKDCIQFKVTAFCYVGEVCRYLVNQPKSDLDRAHSVKLCIGNGTRANIHKEFSKRFNIKVIEIYGATEGNCILVNTVAKTGACGYLPRINSYFKFLPTFVLKVDENMEPLRNSRGFCVSAKPGEKGLLVGLIDPTKTKQQYSGYANQAEASEKKIVKNLFKKDQSGFNTGDMVLYDKDGYVYFVDRLGDTFRWRGENVSTVEVENVISSKLDSKEVIVYGVEVNGQEGKAGMATLMTLDVDIKKLGEDLVKDLPVYARPLFLRLNINVDHTGSLKAQKTELVREGFDVNLFSDKTYYFDSKINNYVELTKEVYAKIQDGTIRL